MYKICFILFLGFLSSSVIAQNIVLTAFYVRTALTPLGPDATAPAFGWQITSKQRGLKQSAFQMIVADNPNALEKGTATFWNSNRKLSSRSIRVAVAGKKLLPAHKFYWRVRVWDQNNRPSGWSEVADFTIIS